MTAIWEIDENAPPEEPPAESLTVEAAAAELGGEDAEAIAGGVSLPADAEGTV